MKPTCLLYVLFTAALITITACSRDDNEIVIDSLGTWIQKNDYPGPGRSGGLSFVIDGKGYWGFGSTDLESYSRDIWSYNPSTDSWVHQDNFPFDLPGQLAFAIGNKGYVVTYSGALYEYDPTLDKWTYRSSFPSGNRPGLTGFVLEGKAYMGTGNNVDVQNFTVYNDFWSYDPLTNQWIQIEDYPGVARTGAVSFVINGVGYVGLGSDGHAGLPVYNDFYAYNPSLAKWSKIADFPISDSLPGIGFSTTSKGYVGVTVNNNIHNGEVYEFSPLTNAWNKVRMFPDGNSLQTNSFRIDDRIFVVGGRWSDYSSQVWEFVPPQN